MADHTERGYRSTAAGRALPAAALAGFLLLPAMFLTWYGPSEAARRELGPDVATAPSLNAFQTFSKLDYVLAATGLLGGLCALVMWFMGRRRGVPGWALLGGAIVGAVGTVGAVLLAFRMIDKPGDDRLISVLPGAFIGLALVVALAVAGWIAAYVGARAAARRLPVIIGDGPSRVAVGSGGRGMTPPGAGGRPRVR